MTTRVRLDLFRNDWYSPGRALPVRVAWTLVNGAFFLTWFPWPSRLKAGLLRLFGARVGTGVVVKPRVNVKYPWNVRIGDHSWIGEGVWIDSLATVTIGAHCCLSQGVVIETGNHDWSSPTFDLLVKPVTLEDGSWAAVGSMLLPGSILAEGAVLGAGSVLSGATERLGIYVGVPASLRTARRIDPGKPPRTIPPASTGATEP